MTSPKPFSRDTIKIPKPVSDIICLYAYGGADIPTLRFPSAARSKDFDEADFAGSEVRLESQGDIIVGVKKPIGELGEDIEGPFELVDGSAIHAECAYVTRRGTNIKMGEAGKAHTTHLELSEWSWATPIGAAGWVGLLHGARVKHGTNLYVKGDTYEGRCGVRLEGNYWNCPVLVDRFVRPRRPLSAFGRFVRTVRESGSQETSGVARGCRNFRSIRESTRQPLRVRAMSAGRRVRV